MDDKHSAARDMSGNKVIIVITGDLPRIGVVASVTSGCIHEPVETRSRLYASMDCVIIGPCNGLVPVWCQAIIWSNTDLYLIRSKRTNFGDIRITVRYFFLHKKAFEWNCDLQIFGHLSRGQWVMREKISAKMFFSLPPDKWGYGLGIFDHSDLSQGRRQHLSRVVCQILRRYDYRMNIGCKTTADIVDIGYSFLNINI